jgi:hypothetical protein
MATTARSTGKRLPVAAASGTIAAGAFVVQEGLFGVALGNAVLNGSLWLGAAGVWTLPVVASKGDAVYVASLVDSVAATLTTNPSGAFYVGVAVEDSNVDGIAPVMLGPQSPRRRAFIPDHLLFAPAVVGGIEGAVLGNVIVSVLDSNDVVCSDSTLSVTVALTVPGAATLGGTKVKAAVAGAATFTDLTVDVDGTYTLTATAADVTDAVSDEFTITNP